MFLPLIGWLHFTSRRHSARAYLALRQTLREVGLDRPGVLEAAHAECQRLYGAIAARYHAGVKAADERFSVTIGRSLERRKKQELLEADQTYQPRPATSYPSSAIQALAETETKYPAQLAEVRNERLAARVARPAPRSATARSRRAAKLISGFGPK